MSDEARRMLVRLILAYLPRLIEWVETWLRGLVEDDVPEHTTEAEHDAAMIAHEMGVFNAEIQARLAAFKPPQES